MSVAIYNKIYGINEDEISADKEMALQYLMKTVLEEGDDVILKKYIDDGGAYSSISKEIGKSAGYVKNHIEKSLLILRHPDNRKAIDGGILDIITSITEANRRKLTDKQKFWVDRTDKLSDDYDELLAKSYYEGYHDALVKNGLKEEIKPDDIQSVKDLAKLDMETLNSLYVIYKKKYQLIKIARERKLEWQPRSYIRKSVE